MGVHLPEKRIVSAGTVLKSPKGADDLSAANDRFALKNMNRDVVHVNTALAEGYHGVGIITEEPHKQ